MILELRSRSACGLLPDEVGHTQRAYRSEPASRVVHVPAKSSALVLGLTTTLDKLDTDIFTLTFWTVHAASSFRRSGCQVRYYYEI